MQQPYRPGSIELALAGAAVALMVAGAAWFYVQRAQRAATNPTAADFEQAAATLKPLLKAGDALAIVPGWSAGQRWRFRRLWRNKGLRFDEAMIFGDPLLAWDFDGFERAWLLSTHGQRERAEAMAPGRVVKTWAFGGGTALQLVQLPRSGAVYDFRQRLGDAEVSRIDAGGRSEDCRWTGREHRCSGAWWRSVKAGLHEVGSTRRRCMFVQPHPDRGELRLYFPDLPKARKLRGYFGNQLWAVRYDEGSEVVLRVLVDGEERHKLQVSRGDFGWHAFEVPLTTTEAGKPITFVISAQDATWRQACLDARLVGK